MDAGLPAVRGSHVSFLAPRVAYLVDEDRPWSEATTFVAFLDERST
jgi:hypothetical protein